MISHYKIIIEQSSIVINPVDRRKLNNLFYNEVIQLFFKLQHYYDVIKRVRRD